MIQQQYSNHIFIDGEPLKVLQFSGGETQIFNIKTKVKNLTVIANNNQALIELLLLNEALTQIKQLNMPYLPYARQDRVGNNGEPLALKAITKIINQLPYKIINIFDCHSDVGLALLKGEVKNHKPHELFEIDKTINCVIAPDAGAAKRCFAQGLSWKLPVIQAVKHRDFNTGEITHTSIPHQFNGETVLIVDDICDGGRTFIELAKALKAQGAGKIILQVTHGIFSQGFEVFKGLIDEVRYTNSLKQNKEKNIYHINQWSA